VHSSSVYRAIVRNKARLTYNAVGAWLENKRGAPDKVAASTDLQSQLKLQDEVAQALDISADHMLAAVREQGLEGIVAKRNDSRARKAHGLLGEDPDQQGPGIRDRRFHAGPHGVDSIIVGYYRGKDLVYVARVRNGFVPATRRMVYEKLKPLVTDKCPFVNLPETGRARWGEILNAEKMKKCAWVRPKQVAVVELLEWTEGGAPSAFEVCRTARRQRTSERGQRARREELSERCVLLPTLRSDAYTCLPDLKLNTPRYGYGGVTRLNSRCV
jgi:ATP-dependent DNA ligase